MTVSPAVLNELAPTGTLRAAINYGNAVLAHRDPGTGELSGTTVDLARKVASRCGVPLELIPFEAAGKVFETMEQDAWDIAFLAIEPIRADRLEFTSPYVVIEGTYMVRRESSLRSIDDVDRAGVKIAVGRGSAYDLYLTRTLKHAEIVRAHTGGSRAMIDLFICENLDVVAGVREALQTYASEHPGFEVLPGRFMEIRQAVCTHKGRPAAAHFLQEFIEEMKRSGFVRDTLDRSGQKAAVVAPAAI